MSVFDDLDNACLKAFGLSATLVPKRGLPPEVSITGITAPTPLTEDVLTGGNTGVTNVYFFVRYVDIDPKPQRGDGVMFGGVSYEIADILVDRNGGATLKLKRN